MIRKPSMWALLFSPQPDRLVEHGAQSPLRRFASQRAATWQPGQVSA